MIIVIIISSMILVIRLYYFNYNWKIINISIAIMLSLIHI